MRISSDFKKCSLKAKAMGVPPVTQRQRPFLTLWHGSSPSSNFILVQSQNFQRFLHLLLEPQRPSFRGDLLPVFYLGKIKSFSE